ncbi:MAG: M15 family metallopeptidase [Saprospiraceae bacterium]|nr:M15 family metallopeptidase [Saprospiraceae bacterium]
MNVSIPVWALPIALIVAINLSCQVNADQQQADESTIDLTDTIVEVEAPPPPTVSLDYIMGKFNPSKDSNFVKIAAQYTTKSNIYLHKEAYAAFLKMHAAAKEDGINLRILSATRNFNVQKSIWESKWNGSRKLSDGTSATEIADSNARALKILEYSSMPGTSRHHWGTDIDLNSLNNPYFEKEPGIQVYQWLTSNAARFGYCQTYTPKGTNRPDGYNEEKWHWSYLPVAKEYSASARQLLKDEDIQGFAGAGVAPNLEVVKKYVFGINPECLD